MTKLQLSVFCLSFGLIVSGAKASDCEGAITADEALRAEDARYAAQVNSDFDTMQRLYGDDLVYVHSTAVVDNKASYIERQRSGLRYRAMRRSDASVRVYGCLAIIRGRPTKAETNVFMGSLFFLFRKPSLSSSIMRDGSIY